MKETDSWKTFERTGTVKDYLQYKSSVDRATKERMQLTCSVSERMEPEKKEANAGRLSAGTDGGM